MTPPPSPPPGEILIPVALTLEPARKQGLWTVDGGVRLLPLNFARRIAHPTESIDDPRHQMRGDETVETLELPHDHAHRLVTSLDKILDPRDPCHHDNQTIFQYVGALGRSLDTPVYRAHNQVLRFGRPGPLQVRPSSIYYIIKSWGSPLHRAFMPLANPERSLLIENRTWCVANTRDLAKLGGIVTATAILGNCSQKPA